MLDINKLLNKLAQKHAEPSVDALLNGSGVDDHSIAACSQLGFLQEESGSLKISCRWYTHALSNLEATRCLLKTLCARNVDTG